MEENKTPQHDTDSLRLEGQELPKEENTISDYLTGYQELELQSAQTQINKSRNALFVVGGISLIANLFVLSQSDSMSGIPLFFVLAVAGIFIGLGFLTNKYPFGSIVTGLIFYIVLWVVDVAVLGPEYLVRGILMRGLIIYFLVKGLGHAKEAERLKRALEEQRR